MTASSKVHTLLQRLAYFPDPAEARSPFLHLVTLFGQALERAEKDLYQVLRAHHVETADNEIGRGYLAPLTERGDLDRILSLYLEVLGGTSQLVRMSPGFTERSFDVRRMTRELSEGTHPLVPLLRAATAGGDGKEGKAAPLWEALKRYAVENTRVTAAEIHPGFVVDVLLRRTAVGAYIHGRLALETREILEAYGGGPLDPRLREAVARDLNERVLPDPAFYRKLREHFAGRTLPEAAHRLRLGIYRGLLSEEDPDGRGEAEVVPTPAGDDLRRLNRMLLESAYGTNGRRQAWSFPERNIPTLPELQKLLAERFNALLRDGDLAREERFPELAAKLPALRERYGEDRAWLNRSVLEAAFPESIERSHAPYRERLMALIQVLRRGASTRQGIVDVVAANLGIVGDDDAARRARALIEVEEFDPRQRTFFEGDVGFWEELAIESESAVQVEPELRVTMLDGPVRELANLRFTDPESGAWVQFPGRVRARDRLVIKGGTVLLNGLTPPVSLLGAVPPLPAREPDQPTRVSHWRFDADVVVPGAETGQERELAVARWYDSSLNTAAGVFDQTVLATGLPVVRVEVVSYAYTPAVFAVVIPYHIPGFTDKFAEEDHPRQQIRELVNRVKAAGVRSEVSYWQAFTETHDLDDAMRGLLTGSSAHDQEPEDAFEITGERAAVERHETGDSLIVAARFDYLAFDGLSAFS